MKRKILILIPLLALLSAAVYAGTNAYVIGVAGVVEESGGGITPGTWGPTAVVAGTDNGYNYIGETGIELSGTEIGAFYYGGANYRMTTGLRFQNVQIPQGATITRAVLTLCSTSAKAGSISATGKGVKEADTATFASDDIWSDRTATTATNAISSSTDWVYGTCYEISGWDDVIEEIVNQASWASGNDLAIWVDTTTTSSYKVFAGYGHGELDAPTLEVDYE